MDKLKELELIILLMEQLDRTISIYAFKHHTVPVAYTYLYELCIMRLLEVFKAEPSFIKGVQEITTKAVLTLLKLATIQNPTDKKLMEQMNKIKEITSGTTIKIPDTVDKFLKQFPQKTCINNPTTQDPADKAIDDYLKKKKKQQKKRKKRGKTKENRTTD